LGAIVNAAGDIASFGGLGDGTPFRVGITDPLAPRRLAEVVRLTGAIATSGTYERGAHVIDPHSGQPMARAASASVTGPDLGLADALATALAVAGEAYLDLIEAIDGYEALVIAPDGSRRWTERFPFAPRAGTLGLARKSSCVQRQRPSPRAPRPSSHIYFTGTDCHTLRMKASEVNVP
jgi:thiamine biosynthesis lipoprotein ApbE